jgi:peroxiredoxin
LTEVDEGLLTLDALLKSGPLVLVFFRFAKSPTCNVALPYYNLYLAPELARVGATLVGVSPQAPQNLREIKEQHALDFRIATDRNNKLGRRFGILHSLDEPSRRGASDSVGPIWGSDGNRKMGTANADGNRRRPNAHRTICRR